ncbi:hypothetical protein ACHAQA_004811 [Verticillium albo-atrum]
MKRSRAVSPNEHEVTLRRERGRKAQREFRQRQVTTIQDLRASNQAMQAAIAHIAQVALRLGDAELDSAVREASRAAGGSNPDGGAEAVEYPEFQALSGSPSRPPLPSQPRHSQEPMPQTYGYISPYSAGSVDDHQPPSYQTGRLSPRLGFGLWLERPVLRVRDPPADIVPYLDMDRASLPSVIFWSGMAWAGRVLQEALDGNPEAAATTQAILGDIVMVESDEVLLQSIQARLSFHRRGYVDADHPGYDPDIGRRVHSLTARLSAAKGLPLETFLRPEDVEGLSRLRLGEDYGMVERALRGSGSPRDMSRVRLLIEAMIRSSACVGGGPRWRTDRIGAILESWVAWNDPTGNEPDVTY